jgi:hypothetical protein
MSGRGLLMDEPRGRRWKLSNLTWLYGSRRPPSYGWRVCGRRLYGNVELNRAADARQAGNFVRGSYARTAAKWTPWSFEARKGWGRAVSAPTIGGPRASLSDRPDHDPSNSVLWANLAQASSRAATQGRGRARTLNPLDRRCNQPRDARPGQVDSAGARAGQSRSFQSQGERVESGRGASSRRPPSACTSA